MTSKNDTLVIPFLAGLLASHIMTLKQKGVPRISSIDDPVVSGNQTVYTIPLHMESGLRVNVTVSLDDDGFED